MGKFYWILKQIYMSELQKLLMQVNLKNTMHKLVLFALHLFQKMCCGQDAVLKYGKF